MCLAFGWALPFHTRPYLSKDRPNTPIVAARNPIVGNMYGTSFARKKLMSGRHLNNGILPHTTPAHMGGCGPAWGGIVITQPLILTFPK